MTTLVLTILCFETKNLTMLNFPFEKKFVKLLIQLSATRHGN